MNTKIDCTIIAFLLTIGIITTISSESIFAKLSDSSVNSNIITNEINSIFTSMILIGASKNNSNSSEI